jgi:hypothetical protein
VTERDMGRVTHQQCHVRVIVGCRGSAGLYVAAGATLSRRHSQEEFVILKHIVATSLLALALTGCSGGATGGLTESSEQASSPAVTPTRNVVELPPAGGEFDYQLAGAYDPAPSVEILARDRTAAPDPDRYTICYVNGFQTQPGEADFWLSDHPDLLVRDADGVPVTDPEWPDEYILDIAAPDRREKLAAIVGAWIDGCDAAGFQAVEVDNLDTYTRFPDRLAEDDAVAFAAVLSARAHAAGLAIGQKNSVELVGRRAETGFDFVVAEQCNEFARSDGAPECQGYVDGYGDQVYVIEYDRSAFDDGCVAFPQLSIVFRDVEVSLPGTDTYVRDAC